MPWSTCPVALLPFLLSWTDSDNSADNFMAGDEREFGSERTSVSKLSDFIKGCLMTEARLEDAGISQHLTMIKATNNCDN